MIRRPRASAIWLAIVRFQIISNKRNWSLSNSLRTDSGNRNGWPAGRMASCASWAFLTFAAYVRGASGKNSGPYSERTSSRAASTATWASVVESVRM